MNNPQNNKNQKKKKMRRKKIRRKKFKKMIEQQIPDVYNDKLY